MRVGRRGFVVGAASAAWLSGVRGASAEDGAWLRAESEHFVMFSRGRERSLRGTIQRLEYFHTLLRELTSARGEDSPAKLPIYLLDDERALRAVWPNVSESVRGFYAYQPDFVGAFAIDDNDGWDGGAQHVLFHEYAHHFMMQYFTALYPAWYVEGFAEYLSTVQFERGRTIVGRPSSARAYTLLDLSARLLPTEVMLAPPRERSERDQQMFYAQSWLMVHYMFSTPERQRAFNVYMRAFGEGGDPVRSFEEAFGKTSAEFSRDLASYMRGSIAYTVYPDRELRESEIVITRMPRAADNLLLLNARVQRGGDDATLLDQVVQEAALYPGDAYALRSAAYAELERNPTHARELVAPLLAADAADYEAHYITGRSYEEDETADLTQARRHFVRAFRANPNHVPTLYHYARTHTGGRMPNDVLDVLIQAHLLAPQVDEIRFNLAIQLLNTRRFNEAATLLAPIAYKPHGGESAERARRYREAALRGEMPEW